MPSEWEKLFRRFQSGRGEQSFDGVRTTDDYGPFPERPFHRKNWVPKARVPQPRRVIHRDLLTASTSLGLRIHQHLARNAPHQNLVVSPISVNLALAMAAMGAKGETRGEIARALGLDGIAENEWQACYRDVIDNLRFAAGGQELRLADSIWITDTHHLRPD